MPKTLYDPQTKMFYGEEYATPEVKARAVEAPAMGVVPTAGIAPPTPPITPPIAPVPPVAPVAGIAPVKPVTAPLGTLERTQQLLARGEELLSPVSKVAADIIKPPTGEAPKDLAVDLVKDIETKTTPGFSEWVIQQPNWQGLFSQALEAGGMPAIKTEVDKIQKEVDRITGKYDEDIGRVEENPFMSDSQKRANIARLKALTNAELTPLLNQYEKLKDRTEEVVRTAERTLGFMEKGYQFAATEAERMRQEQARLRDDARAMIQQYVSTAAIGDFTDEQLQEIAGWGVGYDIASLKALRSAVKAGSELKIEKTLQQMELATQRQELATAKFEAAKAKEPTGNKLTLSEAKSLGLPVSMVGVSETEVARQLESLSSPQWFKEMAELQARASITSSQLQKMWDEFRGKIITPEGIIPKKTTTQTKLDALLKVLE